MDCSLAKQWDCRVCGGDEETADVNFSVGVASCGEKKLSCQPILHFQLVSKISHIPICPVDILYCSIELCVIKSVCKMQISKLFKLYFTGTYCTLSHSLT